MMGQRVRGHFEHAIGEPGVAHLGQIVLGLVRVRRGRVQTGLHGPIANHRIHRRDHAGPALRRGQDRIGQIAGRRLAIGPRDADHAQCPTGKTAPGRAQPGQGLTAARDDDRRRIGGIRGRALHNDGSRPPAQGVGDKTVAVHRHAFVGDKDGAGRHLARIVGNGQNFRVCGAVAVVAQIRLVQGGQQVIPSHHGCDDSIAQRREKR